MGRFINGGDNNIKVGNMYEFVKVDEKGRIHLSKEMRKEIGIDEGGEVWAEGAKQRVVLHPVQKHEDALSHLLSIRVPGSKHKTLKEMKDEARKALEESI